MNNVFFEYISNNVTNKIRLIKLLNYLDSFYIPPVSSLVDIDFYCDKILNNAIIIIAIVDNKDIGFIATYFNDINNKKAFITSIGIDKKYQGKKIGLKLIQNIFDIAKKINFNKIELEVNVSNAKAIKFYNTVGFYTYKNIENKNSKLLVYNIKK